MRIQFFQVDRGDGKDAGFSQPPLAHLIFSPHWRALSPTGAQGALSSSLEVPCPPPPPTQEAPPALQGLESVVPMVNPSVLSVSQPDPSSPWEESEKDLGSRLELVS